uniref:Uncharacterized protein n=1 Tax=Salix viminalis TaxID=40686 RepID=A0A6N2KVT5_SALVM
MGEATEKAKVDVNYNYLQGANEIPLVDKNSRKQISMESTSPHLVMKRKGLMLYPIGSTSSSFGNSSPRGDIKKRSDAVLGTSKCFSREFLLMKRNSFVYTFKFSQYSKSNLMAHETIQVERTSGFNRTNLIPSAAVMRGNKYSRFG